ncbi:MAG: DUF805 domain-containing protein [Hyphomicrobiaceae bacterium]
MFRFRGVLSRRDYAIAALIRIAVFLAVTFAFPFLLKTFVYSTNCRGVGGACGALALVVAIYLKPIIYLVFVYSWLGITVRRLRDAGLPVALVGVLVVLFWADAAFAVVFGSPWTVGFVLGILKLALPKYLIAALICIVFLCLVDSDEDGRGASRFGAFGMGAAVVLGGFVLAAIATYIAMRTGYSGMRGRRAMSALVQAMKFRAALNTPLGIALTLLPLTLLGMLITSRSGGSWWRGPGEDPAVPPGPVARARSRHVPPAAGPAMPTGFGRRRT